MKEFFDFLMFRSKEPLERNDRMMAYLAWVCLIGFITLAILMIVASIVL